VEEAHLDLSFEITNTGEEALPISIGAHPAFNWPLRPVQIQPQSGLQANPFAWSAHPSIFPSDSFSAARGLTRHRISMRFQYRQR
jgi:hypothetical protein